MGDKKKKRCRAKAKGDLEEAYDTAIESTVVADAGYLPREATCWYQGGRLEFLVGNGRPSASPGRTAGALAEKWILEQSVPAEWKHDGGAWVKWLRNAGLLNRWLRGERIPKNGKRALGRWKKARAFPRLMAKGRKGAGLREKWLKDADTRKKWLQQAGAWEKWLKDACVHLYFGRNFTNIDPAPKYVRCIVYHAGDKWRVWKPETVWQKLAAPEPLPTDEILVGNFPYNIWDFSPVESARSQCLNLSSWFLIQIAALFLKGKDTFPGFAQVFTAAANTRQEFSRAALLAVTLHRARKAVFDLMHHVFEGNKPRDDPDEQADWDLSERLHGGHYLHGGRMLKEGFRIGLLIGEANAMLLSPVYTKTAVGQNATRKRSEAEFWEWICTNPALKGLTAKPLLGELHGMWCPAFGGTSLQVDGTNICRSDGIVVMSRRSFASSLRPQRISFDRKLERQEPH